MNYLIYGIFYSALINSISETIFKKKLIFDVNEYKRKRYLQSHQNQHPGDDCYLQITYRN